MVKDSDSSSSTPFRLGRAIFGSSNSEFGSANSSISRRASFSSAGSFGSTPGSKSKHGSAASNSSARGSFVSSDSTHWTEGLQLQAEMLRLGHPHLFAKSCYPFGIEAQAQAEEPRESHARQAQEVLNQKKEVKKRTLDQLILQEVETLLDQKDEREATLEDKGMNYGGDAYAFNLTATAEELRAYGERGGDGETMVTIAFEPGPLGMAFAKNRNGYFVVQSVSGQSKGKNVKVGDVIVTINDEMVESGWSRRDVVDMIRAFTSPDTEEPLVIIFDRQFRNNSVNIIKQRMIEHKQNKGPGGGW
jgi:hypothetical protein